MSLLLLDLHDRPSVPDVPLIYRSKFPEMGKLCGTREQPLDLRAFAGETPSMLLVIVTAAGNKSAGHLNKISTRASCSGVGFRRYGGHTYGQVLGTAGPPPSRAGTGTVCQGSTITQVGHRAAQPVLYSALIRSLVSTRVWVDPLLCRRTSRFSQGSLGRDSPKAPDVARIPRIRGRPGNVRLGYEA